jgi:toluene monooxygenase system protein D
MGSEVSNLVGPVLRRGEIAEAVAIAAEEDNPGKEVFIDEHSSYIRVQAAGECIIRRQSIKKALGRPFAMQELELAMSSFSGQIQTASDHMRFFLFRRDIA